MIISICGRCRRGACHKCTAHGFWTDRACGDTPDRPLDCRCDCWAVTEEAA